MRYLALIFAAMLPCFGSAQKGISDTAFYSIYKNIFTTKCAIPACHDGSFEPDLRTLSSAYATLVYHPIIKNNAAGTFKYRVVPGDTSASVLHERITNCCFVNAHDQMPFTLGLTLSASEIRKINDWISGGSKDVFGKTQHAINLPPDIAEDYSAFYNDSLLVTNNTDREEKLMYKPFNIYPDTKKIKFVFSVTDDQSYIADIKNVKLKIITGNSDSLWFPLANTKDNSWTGDIETAQLKKSKIYFMQLYVSDPVTGVMAFYPNKNTIGYQRDHWSFIVK